MILAKYAIPYLLNALEEGHYTHMISVVQSNLDVGFRPYLALRMNDNNTRNVSYVLVIGFVFPLNRTINSVLERQHAYEDNMLVLSSSAMTCGFEVSHVKFSGLNTVIPCGEHFPPCFITSELAKFFGTWMLCAMHDYAKKLDQEIEHVLDSIFESTSMAFPFNSGMENMYHNYYFWLERVKMLRPIIDAHCNEMLAVQATLDKLRTLIAGRLVKDGSKMQFKAKHYVDLPLDFANKLEELIYAGFPKQEEEQ
jgi:hypothetical protein